MDFNIGLLDGAMESLGWTPSGGTLTEGAEGDFDRLGTGDLTSFVSADTVRNRKNHTALILGVTAASVFVVVSISAEVAQQSQIELFSSSRWSK
jgi:hypothetical protein